jgi:hypothetical protein
MLQAVPDNDQILEPLRDKECNNSKEENVIIYRNFLTS